MQIVMAKLILVSSFASCVVLLIKSTEHILMDNNRKDKLSAIKSVSVFPQEEPGDDYDKWRVS